MLPENKKGRPFSRPCGVKMCYGLLLGRGIGAGTAATRSARTTRSATASAGRRHFGELVILVGREDVFHLVVHVVVQGLHLGATVFRRGLAEISHLLLLVFQNRFDLGLLVIGQGERVRELGQTLVHAHAGRAHSGRSTGGRGGGCGGGSIGVSCKCGNAKRQQSGGSQNGETELVDFHIFYGLFYVFYGFAAQTLNGGAINW